MQQTLEQTKDLDIERLKKLPIIDVKNPNKKLTEKEEKWLREVGTYEFMNIEESGLAIKFTYGNTKNKVTLTFFHGGKYKLPRFIANHVNSCSTPIWAWRPTGDGAIAKQLTGEKSRFQMRELYAA